MHSSERVAITLSQIDIAIEELRRGVRLLGKGEEEEEVRERCEKIRKIKEKVVAATKLAKLEHTEIAMKIAKGRVEDAEETFKRARVNRQESYEKAEKADAAFKKARAVDK